MTETEIIDDLIRREGSRYTNRPADYGGPTKFGITLQTLREEWGAWVTPEHVAALTEPQARAIYQQRYITRPRLNLIPDPRLRAFLVDYLVNGGPVVKDLQRSLGAAADGRIGPDTLARLAVADPAEVYGDMLRSRLRHYVNVVLGDKAIARLRKSNPTTQLENLRGWMNRLGEFF